MPPAALAAGPAGAILIRSPAAWFTQVSGLAPSACLRTRAGRFQLRDHQPNEPVHRRLHPHLAPLPARHGIGRDAHLGGESRLREPEPAAETTEFYGGHD